MPAMSDLKGAHPVLPHVREVHRLVAPFIDHDDAPSIAAALLQGSRYFFGLAPSGKVIGQDFASLVRDQFAFRATFKMEKITRHADTSQPAPIVRGKLTAATSDFPGEGLAQRASGTAKESPSEKPGLRSRSPLFDARLSMVRHREGRW
jgi:hypothetical protein